MRDFPDMQHVKNQPAEVQQNMTGKRDIAQARFKNQNQRIHIITGEILNNNYKNSGYEAYTQGNQNRLSGQQKMMYMPQDLYVTDPITGRRIIRK